MMAINFLILYFLHFLQEAQKKNCGRLFYVAITRAEKYLNVSFIKIKSDGKDAEHSMYVAEIIEGNNLKIDTIKLPEEQLMEFEILNLVPQAPEIDKSENDFITSVAGKICNECYLFK